MGENDFSINDMPTMRPVSASGGGRRLVAGDTILGRYTVVRELGEGGMGVVYQCLDIVGGVDVAVKGLPPEVSRNEDEMDDIRANYQIVRKLRHPNIAGVATLEKDAAAGDYYLVMDLAAGTTLKRWARRHPDVGLDVKLAILRQVAAALDYAHAEKVIHRDVKPENVMVDDDGRVKVLDFGLAAQIRSSQSRTSNTVTSKGGTPGYKSPEQWLGRPQQAPADVYSFGVMAYWMFAGELPFDGDDPVVLGHAVLSAPVGPIHDLPAHMNAALAKALAKAPEDRFSSCTAFVDALEGKVGSRVPRDRMGGPRSRAAVKGVVAAALAIAVVGGWWYYRQEQVREQARIAVEAARQKAAAEEAERIAKASTTEIRIEARVQQSAVRNISDEDGFRAKKDDLDKVFARADALFDEKVKRWSEAAVLFTNYVGGCKALLTLDGERRTAKDARTKASGAKDGAEKAEAEKYAQTRWSEAINLLASANAEFARMQFSSASGTFASAERQFGICATDAKTEKKRREDTAAAQAQAEKEARERAESEAKERAEREARERERRAKWRKEGEEFTINDPYGLYMTMKWCPAGTFTMGSPMSEEGRYDNERQHEVTLTKGFWMGQTEVTQGQWKRLMDGETIVGRVRKSILNFKEFQQMGGNRPSSDSFYEKMILNSTGESDDSIAIYHVNWYEAVEFCKRLTERERAKGFLPDGYEYRLPTETEWEYACRAGTTTALPNGMELKIIDLHNAPNLNEIAWYGGNSSVGFQGKGFSTLKWKGKQFEGGDAYVRRVMQKQPNKFGLYDMIGNVSELCFDSTSKTIGGKTYDLRITRGGGWQSAARCCRSAYSGTVNSRLGFCTVGFRVALAPSH